MWSLLCGPLITKQSLGEGGSSLTMAPMTLNIDDIRDIIQIFRQERFGTDVSDN
jgi:hypothetical protein